MPKVEHPDDLLGQIHGYLNSIEEVDLPEMEKQIASIRQACQAARELCDALQKWVYDQLT